MESMDKPTAGAVKIHHTWTSEARGWELVKTCCNKSMHPPLANVDRLNSDIWRWVKTDYYHIWGNNHPLTNYFRLPRVSGFWPITISHYILSKLLILKWSHLVSSKFQTNPNSMDLLKHLPYYPIIYYVIINRKKYNNIISWTYTMPLTISIMVNLW